MSSTQQQETLQALTVQVENRIVAIPTSFVAEVRGPLQITRVPLSPVHVCGVADLRGSVIPIVDAGIWLGAQLVIKDRRPAEEKDQYAILVLQIRDGVVGVAVTDILDLGVVELLPTSEVIGWEELDKEFITSGIERGEDVIPLIDPESVRNPKLLVRRYRPPVELPEAGPLFSEAELADLELQETADAAPMEQMTVAKAVVTPEPIVELEPEPERPYSTAPAAATPSVVPPTPSPPAAASVTPTAPPAAKAVAKPVSAQDARIEQLKADLLQTPGIQSDAPMDELDFPILGGEPLEDLEEADRDFEMDLWTKEAHELKNLAKEMDVELESHDGKFTIIDKISAAYRRRKS